jgi:hypothetical protein
MACPMFYTGWIVSVTHPMELQEQENNVHEVCADIVGTKINLTPTVRIGIVVVQSL